MVLMFRKRSINNIFKQCRVVVREELNVDVVV